MQKTNGKASKGSTGIGGKLRGQQGSWLQRAPGESRHVPEPAIMQRHNERCRVVVEGTRTDDGSRCTVVMIQEHTDHWGVYPHGFAKFGVRLPRAEAAKAAQAILDGMQ